MECISLKVLLKNPRKRLSEYCLEFAHTRKFTYSIFNVQFKTLGVMMSDVKHKTESMSKSMNHTKNEIWYLFAIFYR